MMMAVRAAALHGSSSIHQHLGPGSDGQAVLVASDRPPVTVTDSDSESAAAQSQANVPRGQISNLNAVARWAWPPGVCLRPARLNLNPGFPALLPGPCDGVVAVRSVPFQHRWRDTGSTTLEPGHTIRLRVSAGHWSLQWPLRLFRSYCT